MNGHVAVGWVVVPTPFPVRPCCDADRDGEGAQWQYERTAGSGPTDLPLEVTDVTVADRRTRYFVAVPGSAGNIGLRLKFTTDGSLRLRALHADLNQLLDDLPLDPSATADVQFSPPVLLGPAELVPGSTVAG